MPRTKRLPIVLSIVQRVRFLEHVAKTDGGKGCWIWTARVDNFGYGHFKVKGRSLKAHRVAWTISNGEIPLDKLIDHLCRNPRCVNPAHMELVTHEENVRRGISPTAVNSRKTHCPKGHPLSGDNLLMYKTRRRCAECCRARDRARPQRRVEAQS